jgi:hypothetical protein
MRLENIISIEHRNTANSFLKNCKENDEWECMYCLKEKKGLPFAVGAFFLGHEKTLGLERVCCIFCVVSSKKLFHHSMCHFIIRNKNKGRSKND